MPSNKRAQSAVHSYFKKYAKKYPSTSFGQHKVTEVEIIKQNEIKRNFVALEAYLTLGDGSLRKIYATLEKRALIWKFVSWENPEGK